LTNHPNDSSATPPTLSERDIRRRLISGAALAPAGANVIMQLSRLPIGHAVAESSVESGSLMRHPLKRTRTTLAYIMIALFGTELERNVLRSQVNGQHRRANDNCESTVEFDTFDRELQLWVAVCMHRGVIDALTFLYGPPSDDERSALLKMSSRFATTLQVPLEMWPMSPDDFETMWSTSLEHVAFDDVTRNYVLGIASLRFLPFPLNHIFGPSHRFLTTGFLPPRFRDELGLSWSPRRERLFLRATTAIRTVNRVLPQPFRGFPWNMVERDTRRRIRHHQSIV
jgi:uncharacterized protein (DUF2236 family)